MELTTILFYLFSFISIASAAIMVFSKNIVHSAFALMFTLVGVAALYVLLYADFLAATQLLVYVGGILILFLFGLMLTSQGRDLDFKSITVNLLPASILSAAAAILLIYAFGTADWGIISPNEHSDTVHGLGMMLMSDYVLPFIIAGVLLLIAIIGAIMMATRLSSRLKKESN
ncbi:NADH-quinone oxidoreductase subunit J [Gracilimonas sp. Q87]|uniref:NADH-quinone oxidoreductase subunit J family protein n=1 Tax=Gracilimonas sp. Q87 TaxID=3384766 RepID=UPI0039842456